MWQKKNNEYKGKSYYYSTVNNLRRQKKINDEFEVMMSSLTLEEVIAVKLELSARFLNNRMYNFPIWKSIEAICREAVVRFALSACRSKLDTASFLGLSLGELNINLKKMKIFLDNEE
jgi:hypothetical protein